MLIARVALEIDRLRMINDFIVKTSLISALVGIAAAAVIAVSYTATLMKPINEMETQLKKTMEENKKAEQIRKDFVANVTHELKLRSIDFGLCGDTADGGQRILRCGSNSLTLLQ